MIKILVADDHAIVRAGLKQLISDEPEMMVVNEAASGAEAVALVASSECDVVLLDIVMPDFDGLDTLRQIKRIKPLLPVVILSGYPARQYAIELIHAGANGYVQKEAVAKEMITAIRAAAQGHKYVDPAVANILLAELDRNPDQQLHASLSEREFQVFCKLAAGQSVSRIADEAGLSVKTVSTYRARIMQKMHMSNNAEFTYYAFKHGLIN
jgi:two-component system, NarL family, invasion response regulator UvrY